MNKKIAHAVEDIFLRCGTTDAKQICDILDITLLKAELPSSTNGFFFSLGGKKAIVISASLSPLKEKYCLAHELGHALLHEHLNRAFLSENTYFVTEKYEREADLFAAYLLLGKPEKEKLFEIALQDISKKFAIPISTVQDWAMMAS